MASRLLALKDHVELNLARGEEIFRPGDARVGGAPLELVALETVDALKDAGVVLVLPVASIVRAAGSSLARASLPACAKAGEAKERRAATRKILTQ
jgi:hypothetical protein